MTKSLEQIQKENRKFILEATGEYKDELELLKQQEHQIYHEIISKSFYSKPLTLSRVLLALLKTDKPVGAILAINKSGFYINLKSDMPWDIKFETLEEQTEEIQRGINKLFNN